MEGEQSLRAVVAGVGDPMMRSKAV